MKTAIAIGILAGLLGCATAPATVVVEQPGNLSASYHSVAVAPVHADTDLTPSFGVVDTDETPTVVRETTVELPEVAPKTDGITVNHLTATTNEGK
jgi:hypothetical protein